ncbi:hypothetical protein ENUP19_0320G0004 [Entamoeba nuttalli]|uniref:NUF1 protein, putative n=2 Tax=Entamoeba nuttalli TaxID=412467 RepID=K2I231_ENTNP|nr:NUF1 protein, putative [Entamoeba nuttalli P19]EKE42900.1 NUF1 protein, putative [Entamoeba nuttalli P19]|eukprot:XP_008854767.1 NUF1 protein, putative [Entamoeba nuttalli P19]
MSFYDNSHQDRMLNATQKLEDATFDIEMSNAILEDTISTEMDSVQELKRQREVLEDDNRKLDRIDGHLDESNKTLKRMLYRAITNKIFLIIMAIVFLIIIGVVIYLGFFVFKKK